MSYKEIFRLSPEERKNELVNELIFIVSRMEDLFQYHPENPNKVDVVEEYNDLKRQSEEIEKEIDSIDA